MDKEIAEAEAAGISQEPPTAAQLGSLALDFTPIIGDLKGGYETAVEISDELEKENPDYTYIGILAGAGTAAALVGLVPGLGDAAGKAIMNGAKSVADKMPEYDPNTVGMFGGNLFAKGYDEPSEKTLGLMRERYPNMEARDEVYRIGEKKDPKSFSGSIDVRVGPENALVEVPTYPAEPERFAVRYNPDRAKVVLKENVVTIDTGEVVDLSRNNIVPTKGALQIEELVEPDDNVLYRGMSAEEYRGALDQGYIKSKGDYNIGPEQQGLTFYSTSPSQAETYSNSFTPTGFKATPDRPAYVVAIKKPETIDYVTGRTEFGIKKEVPTSEIVEVFEGQPYMYQGDVRIQDDWGGPNVSGNPDTAQVTWEKVRPPSDIVDTPEMALGGLAVARKGITTPEGLEMANKTTQLDRKKADKNNDGKLSKYEETVGKAVQNAMADDPEQDEKVRMSHGGMAMMSDDDCGMMSDPMPIGATESEVADDISAMISENEYVLPANVVKWHGLKQIMAMQDEAEMGLMMMQEQGLIQEVSGEEDEYEHHMMYDPETGEGKMTKSYQDHLDLKNQGWGHESETEEESDSTGAKNAEVSDAGDSEQEEKETIETPEGNEIEVAGVDTVIDEQEIDETEEYKNNNYGKTSQMFGMMKKPKFSFIM